MNFTSHFEILKEDRTLFSFPAIQSDEKPSYVILGQPPEISLLIGSFLGQKDLARAQRVNKSWYWAFGRDSLWITHLSAHLQKESRRPPKVECAYDSIKTECWKKGEVVQELLGFSGSKNMKGALLAPNGSWMLVFGLQGAIVLWIGFDGPDPTADLIAGPGCEENPHNNKIIYGGMVSLDGKSAFTFGGKGFLVRWRGLGTSKLSSEVISGPSSVLDPHLGSGILGGSLSDDGQWGITYGSVLVLWRDLESHSPQGKLIPCPRQQTGTIAPDGSWAITISRANGVDNIVLWKGLQSESPVSVEITSDHLIGRCAISPDGISVLSVGTFGEVVYWREFCNQPNERETLTCRNGACLEGGAKFSFDKKWALAWHQRLTFYDMETRTQKAIEFQGITQVFLPLNSEFLVSLEYSSLHLWRPKAKLTIRKERINRK